MLYLTSRKQRKVHKMEKIQELPSNWGRWGANDERGTLNLITDAVRARAVAEAKSGRTVSLGRPIPVTPLVAGPSAPTDVASTAALQVGMFTGMLPRGMAELVILMTHGMGVTHLDALVHSVIDGQVYPGWTLDESGDAAGFRHGSTAIFANGIVTRGVLLDLAPGGRLPAGYAVTDADLDAAAERSAVEVQAGNALVVRGGWDYAANLDQHLPGMALDAILWMHRHDIALYAGDIGDARPPIDPMLGGPLHRVALPRLGMPLIDVADPNELAAVCAEEGRYSFLFVAAPIRLQAASGVPVNPMAIF